jgi:hypothetical protein
MNDYFVHWPPHVRDQLLEFIVAALSGTGRETAELNRALAAIEETLRRTPATAGESRAGDLRVLIESPVAVDYSVVESTREVIVRDVHYSRGRRS